MMFCDLSDSLFVFCDFSVIFSVICDFCDLCKRFFVISRKVYEKKYVICPSLQMNTAEFLFEKECLVLTFLNREYKLTKAASI